MRLHSQLPKELSQNVSLPVNLDPMLIFSIAARLDTKMANSKYYNPHTFNPENLAYQEDIRLNSRDELPSEIDSTDIAESMYAQMFMTELTWPPLFWGGWSAFEPDVSSKLLNEI